MAACGAEDDSAAEPPAGTGAGDGGSPPAAVTELTVTFWPEGRGGPSQEVRLTCDPPGGTHPLAEQACTVLASNADALAPVSGDTICTQIYGGPEEAELTGTLRGEPVEASFSRTNGCEINRWERLATVLRLDVA